MLTPYRQKYNKAKCILAQRHNAELHSIMQELGYVKAKPKSADEKPAEAKKAK